MPHSPRQVCIAFRVSIESISFFLEKSHSLSRILTRGSAIAATTSRVSSSERPTLTTTSSHTSSTERIAGTIGKSSLIAFRTRSEEHTSELQSLAYLVCRLLLEKKK